MSARAWVAFAVVSVLWGIPYLLIKVAVDEGVPPGFVAWVRVVLGAVALLVFAPRAGVLGVLRGRTRWVGVFALSEIVVPFPLIAIGEQHVSSSLTAVLIAAAPLFVALLALRFDASERVRGRRLAGLVIGRAGVVALMGVDVAGRAAELFGALAILTAALFYATGPMVLKRHLSGVDSRASMGATLIVASLLLSPAAVLTPPATMPTPPAIAALLVLGLLCTAAPLVLYSVLIAEAGAGRAVLITYVNPVVAVALGMVVLGERPGVGAIPGSVLILLGSWLSGGGRLPSRRRETGRVADALDATPGGPPPGGA
ncbi:DMT family transporter [Sphaerisporangium viridialbum]|uniref:DMT family transporter n=1 Tax=Sphaerisporangium viridialbum TaxID=46189 RepID=UPI003C719DD4